MKIKRAAGLLGALTIGAGVVTTWGVQSASAAPLIEVGAPASAILELDSGQSTSMVFTLFTDEQFSSDCAVNVQTEGGTATGGADYVAYSATLIFPADTDSIDVTVTITGDDIFEPDDVAGLPDLESVVLRALPAAVGPDVESCAILDGAQATGYIEDDDAPGDLYVNMMPDFTECEAAVHPVANHPVHDPAWAKGYVHARLRLSRNLGSNESLTFDINLEDGTADQGFDFGPLGTPVEPGDPPITGTLPNQVINGPTGYAVDDNGTPANTADDFILIEYPIEFLDEWYPELSEEFTVVVSNVRYVNSDVTPGPEKLVLGDDRQMIIILNDDVIGQEVYVNDPSVVEGNPATNPQMTFTITSKYPAICDGLRLHWTLTPGTATPEVDYFDTNGADDDADPYQGYALIPPGASSVQVPIPTVISDLLIENDETVILTIDGPTGVQGDLTGTGTIVDDDFPWVDISDATVVEGTGGVSTLQFTVGLSCTIGCPLTTHKNISVNYATSNGVGVTGATAPSDYTATSGTLTWAPTDISNKVISVPVVTDSLPENNEFMYVTLSNAVHVLIDSGDADGDGFTGVGEGTIWNDDDWVVNGVDVSVLEGTPPAPNHAVVVNLNLNAAAPIQGFTVDFDLQDQTAAAAQPDYIDADGTVGFASGSIGGTVSPVIVPDEIFEADETFLVNLSNPQIISAPANCVGGCFRLIIGHKPVVTIVNDDPEDLPETGSDSAPLTITGITLLGAGLALVAITRRRKLSIS